MVPLRKLRMSGVYCGLLIFLCQMSGVISAEGGSPASLQKKWDNRYGRDHYIYGKEPVAFLKEKIGELRKGKALCLAAGEGRNAVYLAQMGFEVVAVDISEKGLDKCADLAREREVHVKTVRANLNEYNMGESEYDLITDFYYYDPSLFPKVMTALKPGGHFILQNFSSDQPRTNTFGPRKGDYLVKPNELLRHFSDYRIRYYEDTVVQLDEGMHKGAGAVIRLVVEKTGAE